MRRFAIVIAALVFTARASAQQPVRADTTGRDSARVTQLPEVQVTVTRTAEPLSRAPFATGVLDRTAIQRGQQTIGIDEALNNLPGVVVSNRYNFSLDQRISIRGFGSRSNFGVRGLKVLLDGIPQTLPDGQSQLTNIDFADIERAEVLRGASSSLYGNASGGVISFQSERAAPGPFAQRVRVQAGNGKRDGDAFYKWQSWTSGRAGNVSGTLSVSQFKADGFRQHSAAEFRQLNAGLDYAISGTTIGTLRLSLADDPEAQNPGALTLAEYRANPDSAAGSNILRGADKDAQQYQLALAVRHYDDAGNEYDVSVFGLLRDLANPLAAPPDITPGPTAGTFVAIDRAVGGVRFSGNHRLGTSATSPRLSAGADVQRLRDDRQNFVSSAGQRTSAVFLDQREKVTEFGPFAQLQWSPVEPLLLSTGARYDWVRFSLDDRYLGDGFDDSGARTMSALSGNVGASWSFGDPFVPYVNVSTSFETPTTTELVNKAGRLGRLQPRARTAARGELRGRRARPADARCDLLRRVLPRPHHRRDRAAGRDRRPGLLRQRGQDPQRRCRGRAERHPGQGALPQRRVHLRALSVRQRRPRDGNRLPGVPDHFWRIGLRTALPAGLFLDADQTISSSVAADDANTIIVDS